MHSLRGQCCLWWIYVHSLHKQKKNHKTEAKHSIGSAISSMGRKAGLSASMNNHYESTESQLSHHIISSIAINGFSKNEDIVKSFISKYEKEETDLSPISFHFKPLPGVKSLVGSIQDLSSAFTKIENQFHFKEDFVGINPKKAVQDYNSLPKKFWEDLKNTKDVGKDVGELSTLQAYLGWVKSCAGLPEATDAIERLIMKNDTVTGTDENKVILLIGRVGGGKSSVGNYLIGRSKFKVVNLSRGETQKIKEERCTVMSEKNETLIVYDTPGFFDEKHHSKVATSEIKSQWSTGVHAFVWVLRSDLPGDVDRVLNKLKQRLFEGITEHMIVVFTFCEDPSFTIKGLLEKNAKFKELSNLVGQRVIGIRSKNPKDVHDYERQETLKALLNLVNIIDDKKGKYIPQRNSLV